MVSLFFSVLINLNDLFLTNKATYVCENMLLKLGLLVLKHLMCSCFFCVTKETGTREIPAYHYMSSKI